MRQVLLKSLDYIKVIASHEVCVTYKYDANVYFHSTSFDNFWSMKITLYVKSYSIERKPKHIKDNTSLTTSATKRDARDTYV